MSYAEHAVDLGGIWKLSSPLLSKPIDMTIPGDVYHALLKQKIEADPLYGSNELIWLKYAQAPWEITRRFNITKRQLENQIISLDIAVVDTIASIKINDTVVAKSESMFIPLATPIRKQLVVGENNITVRFESAEKTAQGRARALPYAIPHSQFAIQSPHRNLVRKVQCHSGWDWGPSLMTAGIYQSIQMQMSKTVMLNRWYTRQQKKGTTWYLTVSAECFSAVPQTVPITITVDTLRHTFERALPQGNVTIVQKIAVDNPPLWWPNGYGAQPRSTLTIAIGNLTAQKKIAFRTLRVISKKDSVGTSLQIVVNGIPIMVRGTNWIPTDALPARQTAPRTKMLLDSMVSAHMNMVRIWGGGQYESDYFYQYCDRVGLLVWQDFMFCCALYPVHAQFLETVRIEAETQIKRLKDYACIALWCGNNENLPALTWYEESQNNRDRYLVNYDRLNEGVLGAAVKEYDPDRIFWPSAPCGGMGGDSMDWQSDRNGDMHYWSVWHEGKPFDAYYTVIPRFCTEFGFQSFSSLQTAKSFAPKEELNPTSPIMEHHQRSPNGNTIILETIARYFRFPKDIANIIYISQLQQALAIKTAVEFWRSQRARCGGMLYWQLNDLWPGASWSSIEYNGNWKLFHYLAKRFYAPLHIAAFSQQRTTSTASAQPTIVLYNDTTEQKIVTVRLTWYHYNGTIAHKEQQQIKIAAHTNNIIQSHAPASVHAPEHMLEMVATAAKTTVRNLFLYEKPKYYPIKKPSRSLVKSVTRVAGAPRIPPPFPTADTVYAITLQASQIVLYASLAINEHFGGFSDNAIYLLPNQEKTIFAYVQGKKIRSGSDLKQKLTIFDVASSAL